MRLKPYLPWGFQLCLLALGGHSLAGDWSSEFVDDLNVNAFLSTGNAWIAADAEGQLWKTSDLNVFPSVVFEGETPLNALAAGEGRFVAVGDDGSIVTSIDDGDSWEAADADPQLGDLYGVTYGNGVWVAVGDGASGKAVQVSDNGTEWTLIEGPGAGMFTAVVWDGERFVASAGIIAEGALYHSVEGSDWSSVDLEGWVPFIHFVSRDAAGNLLAGGDSGSLWHANAGTYAFNRLDDPMAPVVTEGLTAAIAYAEQSWLVGGYEAVVLEVVDGDVAVIRNPQPAAPRVRAIYIEGEREVLFFGHFSGYFRDLVIWVESVGNSTARIVVENARVGSSYQLQRSDRFGDWQEDSGEDAQKVAEESIIAWERSFTAEGGRHFFRVIKVD